MPLDVLRAQREALESKRRAIDRAVGVIREVESRAGRAPGAPLSALVAAAVWSHAESKRQMHAVAPRPPDRASESMRALAHDILRAADGGATAEQRDAMRTKWQALVDAQSGGDPDVVAKMRRAWAKRHHWPRGMRDYVASLYDMDADSFERLAQFIERA